ncbi:MAG: hypothetical protein ABEJ77_00325 [Halanaeroarchaeum sp.]
MSDVAVERRSHDRWDEAVAVSNGTIELLAPTSVGPRIVHFGVEGEENEFRLFGEDRADWPLVGGHRLWHAPEDPSRTHVPDLDPVEVRLFEDGVELRRSAHDRTGIEKAITVRMAAEGASVEVTHELTNRGAWPIEFAPWAISVLRPGGMAVLPLSSQDDPNAVAPDRSITYWPYSTPGDERLAYGDDRISVVQESACDGPLKVGTSPGDCWVAYRLDDHAFRKDFECVPEEPYPDRDSGAAVYTNAEMLELETLGPLRTVDPDESVEHVETWTLVDDVDGPSDVQGASPREI